MKCKVSIIIEVSFTSTVFPTPDTYDVDEGSISIDGVDLREWNLEPLRSQISTIEQDIFLFSRTVADNIGFGFALGPRQPRTNDRRRATPIAAHVSHACARLHRNAAHGWLRLHIVLSFRPTARHRRRIR